jgi:hypothetical protein
MKRHEQLSTERKMKKKKKKKKKTRKKLMTDCVKSLLKWD